MRILVVGAGAIGGYFGARLVQAGRDVTFLVRPSRAAVLARDGLRVLSPAGDVHLAEVVTTSRAEISAPFDLVLLSCKAYDLEAAAADIAAAVGPDTRILPLLNGMRHLDVLDDSFGATAVLGGQCVISTTLDRQGTVKHLNSTHTLTYGARGGRPDARLPSIASVFEGVGFDASVSDDIDLAMWEKWVVLASMAGATCLMRAPIGAINRAPHGQAFMLELVDEVRSVATAAGYPPRAPFLADTRAFLTAADSPQTSSMFRDLEAGSRIEADQIIGDLVARATQAALSCPLLQVIYAHLKAYEHRLAMVADSRSG